MSQDPTDLYTLLDVSRQATTEQVEAAFAVVEEARADDPDAFPDETWQRVQYARDVLTNPDRRTMYDSLLADSATAILDVDIAVSSNKLPVSDEPQLLYALLTIRALEQEDAQQRPLNLSLIIDRSTSMRGARLDRVMAAVTLLADKLGPEDVLSLITFSDRAEVVLPATPVAELGGDKTGQSWRTRLEAVTASGGTEIYHGLKAGRDEIRRYAGDGERVNRLILLTDGHTYGDVVDCLRLAEEAAEEGIGISAFGIGSEWNDHFLDALVAPSGGKSDHIKEPGEVLAHLENRLKGLGAVHAQNVRLQQSWPKQLTLIDAFKLAPFAQPMALKHETIPLGDVEGRSPLTFLLAFQVAPQTAPGRIRLPLSVRYRTRAGNGSDPLKSGDTGYEDHNGAGSQEIHVMQGVDPTANRPATSLLEAVRRFNLYHIQEQAWNEAESGNLKSAAARLHQLTTRYMESGDVKLAQQAQQEAQRLERIGRMSPEGRKTLRYGTRSLIGELDR